MIVEPLKSQNFDGLQFPDLCFFQPKKLFLLKDNILTIKYLNFVSDEIDTDLKSIQSFSVRNGWHALQMRLKLNLASPKNLT